MVIVKLNLDLKEAENTALCTYCLYAYVHFMCEELHFLIKEIKTYKKL